MSTGIAVHIGKRDGTYIRAVELAEKYSLDGSVTSAQGRSKLYETLTEGSKAAFDEIKTTIASTMLCYLPGSPPKRRGYYSYKGRRQRCRTKIQ